MPHGSRSHLRIIATTASVTFLVLVAGVIWWYLDRYGSPGAASLFGIESNQVATASADQQIGIMAREPASASADQTLQRGRLIIPVAGVKPKDLVDTFTQAREGGIRVHDAIDIPAPLGTPILAASAGSVEKLFLSDAGGKTIYIRSPDRERMYYYAHLDGYASGLSEGVIVRQGQPIGTVGYSGNASPDAPHLHFEIVTTEPQMDWSERKSTLNPYPLLRRAKQE